ncbi:MAG: insulinase family protein, partial [Mucilaginibacter sp.]
MIAAGSKMSFGQQIPVDTALYTGKLKNGLTYFIRHNDIPKGTADFYIVQKVGSILELDNQRGLAHFLEHEAFNGTIHFPGTSLIDEMEKKGIVFGTNINAYTSFDQTVYNLTHVPTNREGIVDTTLLILHDWSGGITNYDKDIDEERKIIHEEWRTRSSAGLRMMEKDFLPTLLAGTPYAHRLPIGSMDVVDNFKPQELKDYYKKWYRPDLQAIVVVGDIDPKLVLAKLTKLFEDIPAPVNPAKREYVSVPDNTEPIVAISSDAELTSPGATIYWKQPEVPVEEKASREYFKRAIISDIVSNMMSERLSVLHNKKGSPIKDAMSSMGTYSESLRPSWNIAISSTDTGMMSALRAVLTEVERMRRFGFNKDEYEPVIKNFNISNNESEYANRNSRYTFMFTKEYIDQFLQNKPAPTPEWRYNTTKEILENLTIDTLNFYAQRYITNKNMAFEIAMPIKPGVKIPTVKEVSAIWDEVRKTKLKPYVKEAKPNDLVKLKAPKPGRVTKVEKDTSPFGFTKWTLSNGVRVWFKKSNYDEANLMINGYKSGGYSLVSQADLPTAVAYNDLSQLYPFEGFDGRAGGNFILRRDAENINATAIVTDEELLFKYIYLQMTAFKSKPEAFDNWKKGKLASLKGRYLNPRNVLRDTIASILCNNNPWSVSLTDSATIEKVDYNTVKRLHSERFGNASGFTFVITGKANEDSIKRLSEIWLGGLPSTGTDEHIIDHNIYLPGGSIKRHLVEKMSTPRSTVVIAYS